MRGYTLVELLCALGLIAVLIGLLLPVIAQARSRALQVACGSNLAQIFHGLQLYRADYHDYLPRAAILSDQLWSPHYAAAVARYMHASRPLTWDQISRIKPLRCPTSRFQAATATYIMNAMVVGGQDSFLYPRRAHRWRQIVAPPERLPLLMDSPPDGLGHCPETLPFSIVYEDGLFCEYLHHIEKPLHLNPGMRCNRVGHDAHGRNRCNVLFASGEVRVTVISQLPLTDFDDGIR